MQINIFLIGAQIFLPKSGLSRNARTGIVAVYTWESLPNKIPKECEGTDVQTFIYN